jgi:hypothetical protein
LLNLDVIEKELEAVLGVDVLNEGLSAKKAVLIRGCEHLAFLSRYMLDLINYVLCAETMPKNGTLEQMLSKASMDYVESNVIIFATLLSIYSRPVDTFKKQLLEIPDVIMTQANNGAVTAVHDMAKLDPYSNPMVRQFRGSPIYHVRLIFAEWQANRYKAAKDKRQMLELRLLQLKVLQEEVQDPGLERQIQYLQNRIDKLDRTLEEMER